MENPIQIDDLGGFPLFLETPILMLEFLGFESSPLQDWSDMDLSWGVPRWNCSLQLVEAIPSWRVIVFGGTADVYGEVGQRRSGVAFGKKQTGCV